jgi:hypothetical protein
MWEDDDGYDMEREEADFQQYQLEELGRRIRLLEKRGICVHGWGQRYSKHMDPKYRGKVFPGQFLCLNCGKVMTEEEWQAERERLLG